LLLVDYIGDTGMGFIGSQLVADDFYYGKTWEIGLRKFIESNEKNMILYFRPLYKNAEYLKDFSPDKIPDFGNSKSILKINNLSFKVEYKSILEIR